MILLFITSIAIKVIGFILDLLPGMDIPVYEVPVLLTEIMNLLKYILPMNTLNTIFGLTMVITGFRLILAIINKVLNLLEAL